MERFYLASLGAAGTSAPVLSALMKAPGAGAWGFALLQESILILIRRRGMPPEEPFKSCICATWSERACTARSSLVYGAGSSRERHPPASHRAGIARLPLVLPVSGFTQTIGPVKAKLVYWLFVFSLPERMERKHTVAVWIY